MKCVLCGRETKPAVMLADKAVGPKCAKRAGLIERARRRVGLLRLAGPSKPVPADPKTLDLFTEATA